MMVSIKYLTLIALLAFPGQSQGAEELPAPLPPLPQEGPPALPVLDDQGRPTREYVRVGPLEFLRMPGGTLHAETIRPTAPGVTEDLPRLPPLQDIKIRMAPDKGFLRVEARSWLLETPWVEISSLDGVEKFTPSESGQIELGLLPVDQKTLKQIRNRIAGPQTITTLAKVVQETRPAPEPAPRVLEESPESLASPVPANDASTGIPWTAVIALLLALLVLEGMILIFRSKPRGKLETPSQPTNAPTTQA